MHWFFCDYFLNSLILRILLFYRFSRKKISENIKKKGKKSGFVKEKKSGRILLFSSFYNFTDSVNFEDLKKFFDFLIFFLKDFKYFSDPHIFLTYFTCYNNNCIKVNSTMYYLLVCYVNPRKYRIYHKHSTAANNVNDH